MLEAGDTEIWRNDLPASGIPAVFPNLHIILANAHGSPEDFVRSFVDQGWATSSRAVGPLAHLVQQHIASSSIQQKLNENGVTKCVLLFDVLLSCAQFGNGRKWDTLWMGCPVLPNQLLAVLQRQVAIETGSAWQIPADDQKVKLLGELVQITDQARLLAKSIVINHTADWGEVQKVTVRGEELEEAIQLLTTLSWDETCAAARTADLTTTLDLLRQRERRRAPSHGSHPDRTRESWRLPYQNDGAQIKPTFVLAREPSEDEPKLTPVERDELETICKSDTTNTIQFDRARLLTAATEVAIITLQQGGPDITRVRMPYYAESLLLQVHDEFSTSDSLRKIPLVTLAKVFSLRIAQKDNFVFEHLGLLIVEDFSAEVSLTKMRGATQGGQVIKAKKHKWAGVPSMEDIANIVDGQAMCTKRFHHPSILCHQQVSDLWTRLKTLFVNRGGHAHILGLFKVLKTRIEEHALAVRSRALDARDHLPPLQQLQGRSEALYNQVVEAAKQQCLRDYVALRTGPGEIAWGSYRSISATVDADGKHDTYTRNTKAQNTPPTPNIPAPPGRDNPTSGSPAPKRAPDQSSPPARPQSGNKRPKRGGGDSPHVYKMRKNRTPMVELCSSQLVRNPTRVSRLSKIARYQGTRRPRGQGSLYRGTAVFACARSWQAGLAI